MKTVFPQNEVERLKALRRYQILDTPPEPAFDRIAEMAANFFHVPMAGISLVDEDRVWFKSRVGISFDQTARDAGLCSSAMLSQGVYHLSDAAHDERALGHSFVTDLGIRFYAAAPLCTHDGFNLGTLWVLDQKPRNLASGEAEMLRALAALTINQMELRLHAEEITRLERVQRTIAEGVEAETGDRFFSSLARSLALALDVQYAFVTRLSDDGTHFKTLALWERDHFGENVELPLRGTPCESVLYGEAAHYPIELCARFPDDHLLAEWSAQSYCGVPVFDAQGRVFGHVAIIDDKPMPDGPRGIAVMRIFAARVRAEVERLRMEDTLREANERLTESEGRFRDFFEEAPLAYVVGSEAGIIRANRTAARIFGVTPEGMAGFQWRSLFPDTPEVQRRLRQALKLVESGTEACGTDLELRRKEDGRPVWVQWWSKREEGGKYARIMFLDITDRVLMEQEKTRLQTQNEYLQEEIKQLHHFDEIVGRSAALNSVLDQVRLVAPADSTVLLLGETGTGKELIARAIHSASSRRERPLIKVNCAALPASLIESELFGHEKGAFTGATDKRIGRFELANGGTIFLDEIGELPPDVQIKLLRVLQEHEFERIGGSSTVTVDIRVIAATNRDLNQAVAEDKFRRDLFYRLNVFPIVMPPLRQRPDDIALLAHYFVQRYAGRIGRHITHIPATTMARLAAYSWPGNIRELENVIERSVILSSGPDLELPPELIPAIAAMPGGDAFQARLAADSNPAPTSADRSLAHTEKAHIIEVLKQANWRIAGPNGAAAILKLNPSTLRTRMKKLGVERSRDGIP
jgi:formate hydrogenlyase transcriptional activator